MWKRIGEKAPGSSIAAEGLSMGVQGMKGPVVEGELPESKEFGNGIVAQIGETTNPSLYSFDKKSGEETCPR